MKRLFDFAAAVTGLLLLSPFLGVLMVLVWLQDYHSPLYIAARAGRGGRPFRMVKLRSMVMNSDRSGVSSTANTDRRVTALGRFIRRFKLDEFMQLWNVLIGDISLVGPRPQVVTEIPRYTPEEMRILDARPGITDLASIVFADEGDILAGSNDPDLRYDQVIRPWKSRLALLYVERRTLAIDVRIILLTLAGVVSRRVALRGVTRILEAWGAEPLVMRMARREEPLMMYPPPGATEVVAQR